LKRVDNYWERRQDIWKKYNEAFRNLPCITPSEPEPKTRHAYHLYTPFDRHRHARKEQGLGFECPYR